MAKIAFDSTAIDQIDGLFGIGETESADAVRRQYARLRVDETDFSLRLATGDIGDLQVRTDTLADDLAQETQDRIAAVTQEAQDRIDAMLAQRDALLADIGDAVGQIDALETLVAGNAADLAQEVQDRIADVMQEAQTRADALLNQYNTLNTQITNVETQHQSDVQSLSQAISSVAAGTGEQFDYAEIWHFNAGVQGWTSGTQSNGFLRPDDAATDAHVDSPAGIDSDAEMYDYVKLRIKRTGTPIWKGELRWKNPGDPAWSGPATLAEPEFDASGIATTGWQALTWTGTIDQIRLDLSDAQTATDYFEIDWVAVGRPSPGASVAALQGEKTARITQGQTLAQARETLAAQLRGNYDGTDPSQLTQGLVYNERQVRITEQGAIVSDVENMQATISDPQTGLNSKASATDLQQAQATDADARAQLSTDLTAAYEAADSGILTTAKAYADTDSAAAQTSEALEAAFGGNAAQALNYATAHVDTTLAVTTTFNGIQATLNDPVTGLDSKASQSALQQAQADDAAARSTLSNTLTAAYEGADSTVLTTAKSYADTDSAAAQLAESLQVTINDPATGLSSKASTTALQQAQADNQSARSTLDTQLTAAFQNADSTILTTAKSYADSDSTAAQLAESLQITINDPQTGLNSKASTAALQQAQADNDSARSTLETNITAAYGAADSQVLTQAKTYADNDSAAAQTAEALEAEFGGNAANALDYAIAQTDADLAITQTLTQQRARLNGYNETYVLGFETEAPGTANTDPAGWRYYTAAATTPTGYLQPLSAEGMAAYGAATNVPDWAMAKAWRVSDIATTFAGSLAVDTGGAFFIRARVYDRSGVFLQSEDQAVGATAGTVGYSFGLPDSAGFVELVLCACSTSFATAIPLWFDGYDERAPIQYVQQGTPLNATPLIAYS